MFSLFVLQINLIIKIIKLFLLVPEKQPAKNSKMILIDRINISYDSNRSRNNKFTLIFLHGWAQNKKTWNNILSEFRKDFNIFTLDLPGFGESSLPGEDFTLNHYASILYKFIQQMRINKCVIVAYSFGGKVAVKYVAKHSTKVEKLILYSVNLNLNRNKTSYVVRIVSTSFFKRITRIYLYLMGKSRKRFDTLLQIYINTHKNIDFVSDIKKINQQTLLIAGKYDPITPSDYAFKIKKLLPTSHVILFSNSSHLAHLEEKEKFIKVIYNFLDKPHAL